MKDIILTVVGGVLIYISGFSSCYMYYKHDINYRENLIKDMERLHNRNTLRYTKLSKLPVLKDGVVVQATEVEAKRIINQRTDEWDSITNYSNNINWQRQKFTEETGIELKPYSDYRF